jgi:hypothetical protein
MSNSPIKNSTLNRTNLARLNKVFANAGSKGKTIVATETPGGVQPNDTLFLNTDKKNDFPKIIKGVDYFENFALKNIPNYRTIRKLDDDIIAKMYTTDDDYNSNTSVYINTTKNMFKDCANLEEVPRFPFIYAGGNGDGIISGESMFEGCASLKYVDFTNRWVQTEYGPRGYLFADNTTFKNMFKGCTNLKHIFGWIAIGNILYRMSRNTVPKYNFEDFKAYITRTFDSMFEGCASLKKADIVLIDSSRAPATSTDVNIRDILKNCVGDHQLTLDELRSLIKTASKAPESLEIVLY